MGIKLQLNKLNSRDLLYDIVPKITIMYFTLKNSLREKISSYSYTIKSTSKNLFH